MTAIRISRPEAGDRAEWDRLWTAYLAFYETVLPEEIHDSTWRRVLSGEGDGPHGLLAFADGKPVGLVHYIFHMHGWRIEKVCYLQDLYTDPSARGMGVGRALIEAVYRAADANGTPSVYWMTQHFNATARRLYDDVATLTPFIKYQR